MEKARTLIVTVTAWLSFLAALWLFIFRLVPWHAPTIMSGLVVIVFALATYKKID
jgi:hypothetical protein